MAQRQETGPVTVVLTGATGFIGSALQRELLNHGHRVIALVRKAPRKMRVLLPGVTIEYVGLDDLPGLVNCFREADIGIYCAGAVRGRVAADFDPANVEGVINFTRAAGIGMKQPRVVLISSLAARKPHLSLYAESKAEGERAIQDGGSVAWSILRPPAVYGPGDREMLPLLRCIRRGVLPRVGPRNQRLALLHVSDLARAVLRLLDNFDACAGRAFDLHDGKSGGYSWSEIAEAVRGSRPYLTLAPPRALLQLLAQFNSMFASMIGYRPMLTVGKVAELSEPVWLCDNQPLSEVTGWSPAVSLSEGAAMLFQEGSRYGD